MHSLKEAWDLGPEGAKYVDDKPIYRAAANTGVGWKNSNLRTQFLEAARKTGVAPWVRLLHSPATDTQTTFTDQAKDALEVVLCGNSREIQGLRCG